MSPPAKPGPQLGAPPSTFAPDERRLLGLNEIDEDDPPAIRQLSDKTRATMKAAASRTQAGRDVAPHPHGDALTQIAGAFSGALGLDAPASGPAPLAAIGGESASAAQRAPQSSLRPSEQEPIVRDVMTVCELAGFPPRQIVGDLTPLMQGAENLLQFSRSARDVVRQTDVVRLAHVRLPRPSLAVWQQSDPKSPDALPTLDIEQTAKKTWAHFSRQFGGDTQRMMRDPEFRRQAKQIYDWMQLGEVKQRLWWALAPDAAAPATPPKQGTPS